MRPDGTPREIDHLPDAASKSIGAHLAHAVAVVHLARQTRARRRRFFRSYREVGMFPVTGELVVFASQ